MSRLDSLPSDQRAVLALVLQRSRTYEEIAEMLAIDRSAVRERALDGLDALAPDLARGATDRALVGDYLLGQLPELVSDQVRQYIAASHGDSRWAQAIAIELTPLGAALPEIPFAAPLGGELAPTSQAPLAAIEPTEDVTPLGPSAEPREPPETTPEPAAPPPTQTVAPAPSQAPAAPTRTQTQPPPTARAGRRRSRLPIWTLGSVLAVVVVVILVSSGTRSSNHKRASGVRTSQSTTVTPTGTATRTTAASTGTLATLRLSSPSASSTATGVAEVIRRHRTDEIAIDAHGLPANGAHNAYAVWLYGGSGRSWLIGFVPTAVGADGTLQTDGGLPHDAKQYSRLLLTLETQPKPTHPGRVVLSGSFSEGQSS